MTLAISHTQCKQVTLVLHIDSVNCQTVVHRSLQFRNKLFRELGLTKSTAVHSEGLTTQIPTQPLDMILSHFQPPTILVIYLSKTHLNAILPSISRSTKWPVYITFPNQRAVRISRFPIWATCSFLFGTATSGSRLERNYCGSECGFRRNESTTDLIFCISHTLQKIGTQWCSTSALHTSGGPMTQERSF